MSSDSSRTSSFFFSTISSQSLIMTSSSSSATVHQILISYQSPSSPSSSSLHHLPCLWSSQITTAPVICQCHHSGPVVTCATAVCEALRQNAIMGTLGSCVFIMKTTVIYSLWHGLQCLGSLNLLFYVGW